MTKFVQLEDYYVTRLRVDWVEPPSAHEKVEGKINVDYQVQRHESDSLRYRLELKVSVKPASRDQKVGWAVDAHIHGLFVFPDGLNEETMHNAIRVNGGIILFGILRGQIATVTGTFPPGKFVLPTVPMQSIVALKEKSRQRKSRRLPAPEDAAS